MQAGFKLTGRCCRSAPARPASAKDAEPASGSLPSTQPATATTRSLMDLPTAGEKLEHCTKARPRPNRRHKQPPSKPNVSRGRTVGKGGFLGGSLYFVSCVGYCSRYLWQDREMRCGKLPLVYYPAFRLLLEPPQRRGESKSMGRGSWEGVREILHPLSCCPLGDAGRWEQQGGSRDGKPQSLGAEGPVPSAMASDAALLLICSPSSKTHRLSSASSHHGSW